MAIKAFICVMQGLVDAAAFSFALSPMAMATPVVAPQFESLDRNADQRLSRSEASYDRRLSEIFAISDADGDGFVSRTEYAAVT